MTMNEKKIKNMENIIKKINKKINIIEIQIKKLEIELKNKNNIKIDYINEIKNKDLIIEYKNK